jgi:hypothetical protein
MVAARHRRHLLALVLGLAVWTRQAGQAPL